MGLTILDLREARAAQSVESVKSAVPPIPIQAASPSLFQAQDKDGFRRISSSSSGRDLNPAEQDRMQQISFYLYATNGIARRSVEIVKDYVVGEGLKAKSADELVQETVDAFWSDPVNKIDQSLHEYVRELGIFGELCLYAAVNPISGETRLGYIDPSMIDSVEYGTLEGLPGAAVAGAKAVILRTLPNEKTGRRLEVIHREEDPMSPDFGRLTGECFYWAINKARAATRGLSDLFAVADWIDGYDQMLFSMMQHMDAMTRFIWDVEMQGMTGEQLEDYAKKHSAPPKPGTVRFHNEKSKWTALSPSINASDKSEGARMIRLMALGGQGIPEHWYAEGGNANRATALEMGDPTLKMLTTRQLFVKQIIAEILAFVIDRRIAAGVLPEDTDREVKIETPDLSPRDQVKAASALAAAVGALVTAQTVHAIDRATITRFIALLGQSMGMEIDADAVLAAALEEETAAGLVDYTRQPPPPPAVEATLADYDPSQARDDQGQWTSSGGGDPTGGGHEPGSYGHLAARFPEINKELKAADSNEKLLAVRKKYRTLSRAQKHPASGAAIDDMFAHHLPRVAAIPRKKEAPHTEWEKEHLLWASRGEAEPDTQPPAPEAQL